jgi:amphi-Trp domain-containing protein
MGKSERDIEKGYTGAEFASKLRRLADCVETGDNFEIQVAGERIYIPDRAAFTIEHEREEGQEELEFQIRWTLDESE